MTGGTPAAAVGSADADGRGPVLLALARNAIAVHFDPPAPPVVPAPEPDVAGLPWLAEPGACFVTLHLLSPGLGRADGPPAAAPRPDPPRLRGCIGTIEPYRSLLDDVRGNARAAAFRDPRFPELSRAEYPSLHVEVSELSPREPIPYVDRADLVGKLRPGVDGLLLEYGGRRGTYLPQVWDQIPDPSDFLASLVTKARLPQGFWSDDVAISRYTVTAYEEPR